MPMDQDQWRQTLRQLFNSQKLAVLATYGDGQPYCSLMAFAATDDLKHLILTTRRDTRKFANIQAHPQVALLIDNRRNLVEDFQQAMAVTALGRVMVPEPAAAADFLQLYLFKHPYLRGFCQAPACVVLTVCVERYLVVSNFRNFASLDEDYLQIQELRP